jgi:hypothetical protein
MKKHKAAPAGALVTIQELFQLKNVPVRSLRTMIGKGVISHYRFGYRMMMFSPKQFDEDIAAFMVKSRFASQRGANGE